MEEIPVGKGRLIQDGEEVAVLSIGHIGNYVVEAFSLLEKDEIFPAHYDMRFVKPLDAELLHYIFSRFKKIITIEDGCLMGGFGSAVLEFMADNGYSASVIRLGIPDAIFEHGEQLELHQEAGMDPESIRKTVLKMLEQVPATPAVSTRGAPIKERTRCVRSEATSRSSPACSSASCSRSSG